MKLYLNSVHYVEKGLKKAFFSLFYVIITLNGVYNVKKKLLAYCGIGFIILFILIVGFNTVKVEKPQPEQKPDISIKKTSNDDILRQVLNNEKEFINSVDSNEILLSELKIEDAAVKINRYAFVDLDNDSKNDVIAMTDSYYDYTLVLHIENNIIYGYLIKNEDLKFINTNGIIYKNKEDTVQFQNIKFTKNNYKFIDIASYENDKYRIEEEEVSKEEFDSFEEKFSEQKLLSYRSVDFSWMEKRLISQYSYEKNNSYYISPENIPLDFLFMTDKSFENFSADFISEKFNIYYANSNADLGRVYIRKRGEDTLVNHSDLMDNYSVGLYDEESQYIAIVINNDRLNNQYDNNYDVYYFKYYNKEIQYLGFYKIDDLSHLFQEEALSELENSIEK